MNSFEQLKPKIGDYVLATTWDDGDPRDPWAIGFYAGLTPHDKHIVLDSTGASCRESGYGRVGRITPELGKWLLENRVLLESAPPKIKLWGMLNWSFINEAVRYGGVKP